MRFAGCALGPTAALDGLVHFVAILDCLDPLYTPLPNASPHKTFVLGGNRGLVFGGGLHLGAKQKKMHRAGIGMLLGERAMVGTWTWG